MADTQQMYNKELIYRAAQFGSLRPRLKYFLASLPTQSPKKKHGDGMDSVPEEPSSDSDLDSAASLMTMTENPLPEPLQLQSVTYTVDSTPPPCSSRRASVEIEIAEKVANTTIGNGIHARDDRTNDNACDDTTDKNCNKIDGREVDGLATPTPSVDERTVSWATDLESEFVTWAPEDYDRGQDYDMQSNRTAWAIEFRQEKERMLEDRWCYLEQISGPDKGPHQERVFYNELKDQLESWNEPYAPLKRNKFQSVVKAKRRTSESESQSPDHQNTTQDSSTTKIKATRKAPAPPGAKVPVPSRTAPPPPTAVGPAITSSTTTPQNEQKELSDKQQQDESKSSVNANNPPPKPPRGRKKKRKKKKKENLEDLQKSLSEAPEFSNVEMMPFRERSISSLHSTTSSHRLHLDDTNLSHKDVKPINLPEKSPLPSILKPGREPPSNVVWPSVWDDCFTRRVALRMANQMWAFLDDSSSCYSSTVYEDSS
eukprot:m.2632 g.2632  ORF g.2632 m.2632 type:complete len:485 (+) comp2558_c0_seq1:80-1534(+)